MNDLAGYWESHPPVHLMVAAYLGVKPKEKGHTPTREEIEQFVAMFGRR